MTTPQSPPVGDDSIFKLLPDNIASSPELPIVLTRNQYDAVRAYILAEILKLINTSLSNIPKVEGADSLYWYTEGRELLREQLRKAAQARFGGKEVAEYNRPKSVTIRGEQYDITEHLA